MPRCLLLTMVPILVLALGLDAGEPSRARELPTKGLKIEFTKGRVQAPWILRTQTELEKFFVADASETLKKDVDFSKEKLVLFVWGGSGRDQLVGKIDREGKQAVFTYTPGLTRDFRRHLHLFVLPREAEIKIDLPETR